MGNAFYVLAGDEQRSGYKLKNVDTFEGFQQFVSEFKKKRSEKNAGVYYLKGVAPGLRNEGGMYEAMSDKGRCIMFIWILELLKICKSNSEFIQFDKRR